MEKSIDISKLDKAAVLAALYNASRPQGMGFLQYNPSPMTRDQAAELLKQATYFDYLMGRVMKIGIADQLFPALYDRDNGPGAAERAISFLLQSNDPNAAEIRAEHQFGKQQAAEVATNMADSKMSIEIRDGVSVIKMGCEDVKKELIRAIKRAK